MTLAHRGASHTLSQPSLSVLGQFPLKQLPLSRDLLVLLSGIVLLALASPLIKWMVVNGDRTGLVAPNAISYCNALFVGNLCAGLTALLFFGPRATLVGARRDDTPILAGPWCDCSARPAGRPGTAWLALSTLPSSLAVAGHG